MELSRADESKLWPLIEKWESTGHDKGRVALATALEQIWKNRYPDPEAERESEEESDKESEKELYEESEGVAEGKSEEESEEETMV